MSSQPHKRLRWRWRQGAQLREVCSGSIAELDRGRWPPRSAPARASGTDRDSEVLCREAKHWPALDSLPIYIPRGIQARSEAWMHSIWQVRTVAAASFRRQLWGRMAVLIRATQRQDVCGPSRIVETSESPRLILGARDNAPTRSALTLAGLNFTEVPRRLNRPLFHGLGRPR